jgi:hypothetical protein
MDRRGFLAWTLAGLVGHSLFCLSGGVWTRLQAQTTVQLPTFGIAIDAQGVLSVKEFPDAGGRLHARRLAAAKVDLPGDVLAASKLRKVSLVRLERAVRAKLDQGLAPDAVMQNLAGLQQLQYVFYFPERRDLVIAGPAEGWCDDASGRTVGVSTGRPVLRLDDLLVALRAYRPGTATRPFIGCTIDPDPHNLQRLREFQKTIPHAVPQNARQQVAVQIARGMQDSLGLAQIRVFHVPADSHFAAVLVEADYRMKLIGLGLEPPPVKMATFLGSLQAAPEATLQRWWFTPNYDCVRVTPERHAMELVGQGVQLCGEDKMIGPDGTLLNAKARPSKASELFTTSFTRLYPEIAARSPVFAQLRNLIDLLVAAAFLRQQDFYGQAGWPADTLGDNRVLPIEPVPTPKTVACVANSLWKGNRLFTPAGGGVSILPDEALDKERWLDDKNGELSRHQRASSRQVPDESWWWD